MRLIKSREFLYWIVAVPLALGLAAGIWLAFFSDLRIFRRTVSQDDRKAESVSASPLPSAPVRLLAVNKKDQCPFIDSIEVDGGQIRAYWHNRCAAPIQRSTKYAYKVKSPDGTVLKSDWSYATVADVDPGERLELEFKVDIDPRMATLELSLSN